MCVGRALAVVGLAAIVSGCELLDGLVSPTSPGPSSADAVAGRVVSGRGGDGLAGALIEVEGLPPARTDSSGAFRLEGARPGQRVRISAEAHLGRETSLLTSADTAIDLISLAPPFSLDFYRELGRDATSGRLSPLVIWAAPPSFYVTGRDRQDLPVPPAIVDLVTRMIHQTVAQATGGRFGGVRVETGSETRAPTRGWITVEFSANPTFGLCGEATVGSDPGRVLLGLQPANDCGLGLAPSPGCIAHEVGHGLGSGTTRESE